MGEYDILCIQRAGGGESPEATDISEAHPGKVRLKSDRPERVPR